MGHISIRKGKVMLKRGSVVQFAEKHKWAGYLGFIDEAKETGEDVRYMIGVPIPEQGTTYVYSMESKNEFYFVGHAVLVPKE